MELKLLDIIKNVSWGRNNFEPFDIAIAKDEQGNLHWGQSLVHPSVAQEEVVFYPVPDGIGLENYKQQLILCEGDAPWLDG